MKIARLRGVCFLCAAVALCLAPLRGAAEDSLVISRTPDGGVVLNLRGTAYSTYSVQYCDDLATAAWKDLTTGYTDSQGSWQTADSTASASSQRFYRARFANFGTTPTYDYDFGPALAGPVTGDDQQTTLAVDSVGGNDAAAGTLQAPRQSLPTSLVANEHLGLYRGSLFRASLPLNADPSLTGISVRGVARGSTSQLPVISALDPAPGPAWTSNGDGTYSYAWTSAEPLRNDGYDEVYVVEISTATESITPIASRHRMRIVTDASMAAATPGSVLVPVNSGFSSTWTARIHPTDGQAPGTGSYRYEVVSRYCPANWVPDNARDGLMGNLTLLCGNYGYGVLAAPTGFTGDRLAFIHGSTHNAVIAGGSLQRSVFYEQGNGGSVQLAVYHSDATGLSWSGQGLIFYGNQGPVPGYSFAFIAHSGDNANKKYEHIDLTDTAFLGWVNPNPPVGGGNYNSYTSYGSGLCLSFDAVQAGSLTRCYLYSYGIVTNNDFAGVEVSHSVIRNCSTLEVPGSFHDNILALNSDSFANSTLAGGPVKTYAQLQIAKAGPRMVANNILWYGVQFLAPSTLSAGDAWTHNVMILGELNANYTGLASAPSANPTGVTHDYNLVVHLGGSLNASGGQYASWAAYRATNPNLDAHSLYVDLRADPRGINAVFADATNGDFRWANTDVGQKCATYCAANNVGPATVTTRWPVVPAVDAAVATSTAQSATRPAAARPAPAAGKAPGVRQEQ